MEEIRKEYLTEEDAFTIKDMLKRYLKSYEEKDTNMTDKEWLEQLFKKELPEMKEEDVKRNSEETITAIKTFDENLELCTLAYKSGLSKERWLADKIQEESVGMAISEYGKRLQEMDNFLYTKNAEMADALSRSADGHIMMSPNLDGNIAENMIAKTTELSASLQGKNISVSVLESHAANSVDVRAINHDTGRYQNYQLKFGKTSKETIRLIERGNYNNQRIVVPSEQVEEIQAYFKEKGSSKTITDHIDAWGTKGKSFTKEEMKSLQERAQKENFAPEVDYNHYQTKDLAMNIGKNVGVMALQSATVTTGLNVAFKIFRGEEIDKDELVEAAIKVSADTSIKTVVSGTLQVAIRKGVIKFINQATPAGVISNMACVGVENAKVLAKIAFGELSLTKGIDQMGRITVSMMAGLWGISKSGIIGATLTGWIPFIGPGLAVITGFIGGTVGYFGGAKLGDKIYYTGKKVAKATKNIARVAFNEMKSLVSGIKKGITSITNPIATLLGF